MILDQTLKSAIFINAVQNERQTIHHQVHLLGQVALPVSKSLI